METYIQTGIGVIVSVVLFLVTYRQTIGARRQRAILANAELHRAVVRRMVLEGYQPTPADLERLARGKARHHRIPFELMDSAAEALTDVYAAVFDNDLIPAPTRDDLHKRVAVALEQTADPAKERLARHSIRSIASPIYVIAILAASVVGAVATVLASVSQSGTIGSETVLMTLVVFVTSVAVTTAIVALRRVREKSEATIQPEVEPSVRVFREVRRTLGTSGVSFETFVGSGPTNNVDFLVTAGDRRIAVETFDQPDDTVRRRTKRLLSMMADVGANELWIVTRHRVGQRTLEQFGKEPVRFLAVDEFATRIADLKMGSSDTKLVAAAEPSNSAMEPTAPPSS